MQAVLIIAHKDVMSVIEFALTLKKRFLIYIHFDRKCFIREEEKLLMKNCNIYYFQEISVNWGAWSVAEAALFLMKEAMKNQDVEYVHLVSGQDWIGQNVDDIYEFYRDNKNIYISYSLASELKKSNEPLIFWQKFYFYYDCINRKSLFGKIFHRISILIQYMLGVNKFKKYNIKYEIYQGPNWMDLPRYAVEYVLDFLKNNENYLEFFSTGFCTDEFWVQTILVNSEFKSRIIQDTHRYINWVDKNGSYPAILDESDFHNIEAGDYHFIRKVDDKYSKRLKEMLSD